MKSNLIRKAGLLFLVFSFLFNSFSTPTAAYALNAPSLIAPANNANKTASDTPPLSIPEFKWAAVTGATSYRLQISSDVAFTTLVVDIATPYTSFTPTSATYFTDGDWYWHVRVETPTPVSVYSGTWHFTKNWADPANLPTLVAPANGATIDFYDSPTFSWTPVTGASQYLVEFSSSSNVWTSLILPQSAYTISTSYQPAYKLPNGVYYWRVVPIDLANRQGTPSAQRTFTASYNFVPQLLGPANNSFPAFTPTFSWTAVRGAQKYILQYGTSIDFTSGVTTIETTSTSFTPTDTIPNDVDYYWRVKAQSGLSVSDWNPAAPQVRKFRKQWYIKGVGLTPTNNYIDQRFPMFSWTPVPGASYYYFQLSVDQNFSQIVDDDSTSNTFYTPKKYYAGVGRTTFYWRVTAYDASNHPGATGDTISYQSAVQAVGPEQVYPLFYYPPDTYVAPFSSITTNPHEDRTVGFPIFIWHRVYKGAGDPDAGQVYADAYQVEVSDDPGFDPLASQYWTVETQNTTATPTTSNPFVPVVGKDYFWHVRPLVGPKVGGSWSQVGPWSQTWRARFDKTSGAPPTNAGTAPQLIRPTTGYEFNDTSPLLEWFPVTGATAYDVEISLDQNFGSTVDTATVSYPAYAPTKALAQRSLGSTDFGVYYWRVRQSPSGTWSSVLRFQIAAPSQWKEIRTLGDSANRLQIGSDPTGDVGSDYDLTDLNAAQSMSAWSFGFHLPSAPTHNVTFALYLDIDHKNNSGGTSDPYPTPYNITTISTYRPEYAIYIPGTYAVGPPSKLTFSASTVRIYKWNENTGWDPIDFRFLNSVGGSINANYVDNYVEIQIPNTAIGSQDDTGTYTASLLSFAAGGGSAPQDSVPSDPNVPGTGPISRFSNVTERINILAPPNNAGIDPLTYSSIQPYFWDYSVYAPWNGYLIKTYTDATLSSVIATKKLDASTYWSPPSSSTLVDFSAGDTAYYWRVQPQYFQATTGQHILGPWSQSSRLERRGLVPQNLKTSVTFATPTFSWDMVEGASTYELQVDNDPLFPSPEIDILTAMNSYTNRQTLPNATYYWRVRVNRAGNVTNGWTASKSFILAMPAPTGLTPASGTIVSHAPTLCWTPVIKNDNLNNPVLAAYKYYVQISRDVNFSTTVDNLETEESCFTPGRGYLDGLYYWHVAMVDGDNRASSYSSTNTFTKQYPTTKLVSPTNGSGVSGTPTFVWTPVDGAAYYKLEISQFATFSPADTIYTENTRFTPTSYYPVNQTYYWRVSMVDKDNMLGPANSATIILKPPTSTFYSIATHDGWTLESSETSGKGSSLNSTMTNINLGDDGSKKQYRSIISFSTGDALPDNAVIDIVMLKVKKHSIVGSGDPVALFQGFLVDIKTGFFGTSASLETLDFQSAADKNCGPYTPTLTNNAYNINLTSCGKTSINKMGANNGVTQIRLRFKLDDNNNSTANILKLYSGDATTPSDRPQLVVTYHLP